MTTLVSPHSTCLTQHLGAVGIDVQSIPVPSGKKCTDATKKLIKYIEKYTPDIFFLMKDPQISPGVLRLIKKVSPKTKTVMWYGDQRGNTIIPLVGDRIPYLDCLLVTNNSRQQNKMYRDAGIPHVHTFYHSFSVDEFKLFDITPEFHIFFGGSNFKPTKFPLSALRTELVKTLHKKFKLVVHGGGWPFATRPWILRPKYAKALRTAHMNLGINHYDVKQYYNRRLFESVASGKLHITYYIPGMEEHFKNHEHLVWFKSIKEGVDVFKFYLNHPKARKRIESTGREFFIKNHSWPVRVKRFRRIMDLVLK